MRVRGAWVGLLVVCLGGLGLAGPGSPHARADVPMHPYHTTPGTPHVPPPIQPAPPEYDLEDVHALLEAAAGRAREMDLALRSVAVDIDVWGPLVEHRSEIVLHAGPAAPARVTLGYPVSRLGRIGHRPEVLQITVDGTPVGLRYEHHTLPMNRPTIFASYLFEVPLTPGTDTRLSLRAVYLDDGEPDWQDLRGHETEAGFRPARWVSVSHDFVPVVPFAAPAPTVAVRARVRGATAPEPTGSVSREPVPWFHGGLIRQPHDPEPLYPEVREGYDMTWTQPAHDPWHWMHLRYHLPRPTPALTEPAWLAEAAPDVRLLHELARLAERPRRLEREETPEWLDEEEEGPATARQEPEPPPIDPDIARAWLDLVARVQRDVRSGDPERAAAARRVAWIVRDAAEREERRARGEEGASPLEWLREAWSPVAPTPPVRSPATPGSLREALSWQMPADAPDTDCGMATDVCAGFLAVDGRELLAAWRFETEDRPRQLVFLSLYAALAGLVFLALCGRFRGPA